jgi:hypothetical protein
MNQGQTVLSQIIAFISKYEFDKCVKRYNGNHRVRSFTCWEQYIVMSFAQLTYRESLRDIESCLSAIGSKLYHSGIRSRISRSTLSEANERREWRIYYDYASGLIKEARQLYLKDSSFNIEIDNLVYVFDSTTIDLCLSLFPWANFRQNKGAIKLHTQLDLRGSIPTFIHITNGKVHDVNALDLIQFEPGAIYILDRGYTDFKRLNSIDQAKSFFVIRAKDNFNFKRISSTETDKSKGVIADQQVSLYGFYSSQDYPGNLRRIRYRDLESNQSYVFLTNNHHLPALTIAALYKERWKIELFFKWIKQHLRIKSFYGTSPNAVYTQVWIAISNYLLIAIIKKKLNLPQSLYSILQVLSLTLFERTPLKHLLKEDNNTDLPPPNSNQLIIFDF